MEIMLVSESKSMLLYVQIINLLKESILIVSAKFI